MVQALDRVVDADTAPVLAGEGRVRQGLGGALAGDPGGLTEPHPLELVRDRERLCLGGLARPHGVDRLEHGRDRGAPGLRHAGEHVAVEVHGAAPVGGIGEHLRDRADHARRLVPDDHPHAAQPAGPQPGQEVPPALRRLREALCGADDLAAAVLLDADGDHGGDVLAGASPAALQVYPVDVDAWVGALERAVPPLLDRGERLLVQVGDGRGGDARPPEDLGCVLDPPGRDPGEAHLEHRLLDGGLPPAAALDDRRREAWPLELGHADRYLVRARRQAAVVVAGAVSLPRSAVRRGARPRQGRRHPPRAGRSGCPRPSS